MSDANTIETTTRVRPLSECLDLVIPFLYNGKSKDESGQIFICMAITAALKEGVLTPVDSILLKSEVYTAIEHQMTLGGYLHCKKRMPESCKNSWGYDLHHPDYIKLRDEFISDLRTKLQLKEARL